jgi:hypothetical protein
MAARLVDLSQDEEGPVGFDFDADFRIFDVFPPELRDVGRELEGVRPRALTGPIKGSDTEPLGSTL